MPAISECVSDDSDLRRSGHSQVPAACIGSAAAAATGWCSGSQTRSERKPSVSCFCENFWERRRWPRARLVACDDKVSGAPARPGAARCKQALAGLPLQRCSGGVWQVSVVHSEGSLVDAVEEGFAAMHARLESEAVLDLC